MGDTAIKPIQRLFLNGGSSQPTVLPVASLLALDHCSDGVLIADMCMRDQPIVHVNTAFESITGYAAAEAIGKNCRYLQGNDRLQPQIAEIRAGLTEGRTCSVTLRNYRRDGAMFRNALRLVPLRDDVEEVTHYIGLIRDVTHAAGIDRLTGLLDRYGLLDRLAKVDARATPALLLVKLDIARFHDVNNGFGYDVGDALLRSAAARLVTLPATAVSRMGPNTFAVAFELDDSSRAPTVVDDILALLKPRFVLPGASLAIQFAAGFAVGYAGANPLQIIRQAGAALRRSKAGPAHKPQAFAAADERDARNRIRLTSELQTCVANQEMLFHYQPQVDLISGDLVGAEALLRWNHGAFGLQPPSRFIGIAEETGALVDIGAWGLRTLATHAAQVNRDRRAPLRFALNVSALEFTQRDMVGCVQQVLDETGCRAEWLTLELTESLKFRIRTIFGARSGTWSGWESASRSMTSALAFLVCVTWRVFRLARSKSIEASCVMLAKARPSASSWRASSNSAPSWTSGSLRKGLRRKLNARSCGHWAVPLVKAIFSPRQWMRSNFRRCSTIACSSANRRTHGDFRGCWTSVAFRNSQCVPKRPLPGGTP